MSDKPMRPEEEAAITDCLASGAITAARELGMNPLAAMLCFVLPDGTIGCGAAFECIDAEAFDAKVVRPIFNQFEAAVATHIEGCLKKVGDA